MSAAERRAPIFAALGDETRLRLVERLGAGEALSITELTDGTGLTRQAVTKHLRVLHEVGLARSAKRGRQQVWELSPAKLRDARRFLETVSDRWDRVLEKLKKLAEE